MEIKKSKTANLERKRGAFFSIGLLICGSAVLMAFSYSTVTDATVASLSGWNSLELDTLYEPIDKPEPPVEKSEARKVFIPQDDIKVVDDDEIIDTTVVIFDDCPECDIEEPDTTIEDEPILDFAETEPSFPGGEVAMMEFIQANVVYPIDAIEMREQGIVYVQFVVGRSGLIEDITVQRGVSEGLDKEAVKVVKKMPTWIPGEQAGKKVKCRFTLPINFRID